MELESRFSLILVLRVEIYLWSPKWIKKMPFVAWLVPPGSVCAVTTGIAKMNRHSDSERPFLRVMPTPEPKLALNFRDCTFGFPSPALPPSSPSARHRYKKEGDIVFIPPQAKKARRSFRSLLDLVS